MSSNSRGSQSFVDSVQVQGVVVCPNNDNDARQARQICFPPSISPAGSIGERARLPESLETKSNDVSLRRSGSPRAWASKASSGGGSTLLRIGDRELRPDSRIRSDHDIQAHRKLLNSLPVIAEVARFELGGLPLFLPDESGIRPDFEVAGMGYAAFDIRNNHEAAFLRGKLGCLISFDGGALSDDS